MVCQRVWDQHPAKAYRKLPTILCYKFPDYVPPHQILLLSNLISIFIIHDMREQYEAFCIYLTNRYKGAQVLENGLAHLQTYCPIWLRLALVSRVVETGMVLASANEYLRSLCGMGILCCNEDLRPKAHNAMQYRCPSFTMLGCTIASNGSLSALYIDSTF